MNRSAQVAGVATVVLALGVLAASYPLLLLVPGDVPVWDFVRHEWFFPFTHRAAWVLALLALAVAAVAGAGPGRTTAVPGVAWATALLAAAWAAVLPAGWAGGATLRGSSFVLACLLPAALLHLALALRHDDALTAGTSRRVPFGVTVTAYLLLGGLALGRALSRDPFLDLGCLVGCGAADPVVDAPWLARGTSTSLVVMGGALALAAVVVATTQALTAAGTAQRVCGGLLAVCAALEVGWAWWPGARPGLGPFTWEAPRLLLEARAAALVSLAVGLLTLVLLRVRRRAAFRALAREIAEVTPPGSMREVVAARIGDPGASLEFRVPGEAWVDERGRAGAHRDARGRKVVTLSRAGQEIARIIFDVPGVRARDLEQSLGPAALLALDAERAGAEQLLRLRVLRDTRRRAVEASDAARRRAERDLHDGAQHLLLAATFALRDGVQLALEAGDQPRADLLGRAVADVSDTATTLRSVAHGIYPVLLGDSGLVPALEGLARESPVPVAVDATAVPRVATSLELTVYRAAALAVRAAAGAPGSPALRVCVSHCSTMLTLALQGAPLADEDLTALTDRVEAVGGTMVTVDSTLRLELPCE